MTFFLLRAVLNTGVNLRLSKLEGIMEEANLDAVLITYEWNVFYFTQVPRPAGSYLLLIRGDEPKMVVPALDFWRIKHFTKEIEVIPYSAYDIPGTDVKPIRESVVLWLSRELSSKKVGLDISFTTSVGMKIKEKLGDSAVDIGEKISELRAVKESEEITFMKEALRITESALRKVLIDIKQGLREYEVAAMLESGMRFLGADGYAFETIVASGPNGAFPHALPTNKEIMNGDEVVIDMGARFNGYCSDMTRTPVVGKPSPELRKVIEAVNEAVNEATDKVGPGVEVSEVDGAARKVLNKYGLSRYFIHSLGHGVGVEVHEIPRVAQGVKYTLEPGMVITIEPGVYINGKFGVRIENMVVVTKSGHEVLNTLPNID